MTTSKPDAGAYGVRDNPPKTWVFVFDLDATSPKTPNPIRIEKMIAADADALSHFALKEAAEAAVARASADGWLLSRIQSRLASWWPELAGA